MKQSLLALVRMQQPSERALTLTDGTRGYVLFVTVTMCLQHEAGSSGFGIRKNLQKER